MRMETKVYSLFRCPLHAHNLLRSDIFPIPSRSLFSDRRSILCGLCFVLIKGASRRVSDVGRSTAC